MGITASSGVVYPGWLCEGQVEGRMGRSVLGTRRKPRDGGEGVGWGPRKGIKEVDREALGMMRGSLGGRRNSGV